MKTHKTRPVWIIFLLFTIMYFMIGCTPNAAPYEVFYGNEDAGGIAFSWANVTPDGSWILYFITDFLVWIGKTIAMAFSYFTA